MKVKKSKGKPAAKRATKDLAPRKSKDVKGGSILSQIGNAIKTVAATAGSSTTPAR